MWNFLFFLNGALLGVGLAMDAFSVSLANGLAEPEMKRGKHVLIPLTFALFQFLMPMLGWVCVHFAAERFKVFERAIPYIALALLLLIGGKMLVDGIKNRNSEEPASEVTLWQLFVQGIATSIAFRRIYHCGIRRGSRVGRVCGDCRSYVRNLLCGAFHRKEIRNETCGKSDDCRRGDSYNYRS